MLLTQGKGDSNLLIKLFMLFLIECANFTSLVLYYRRSYKTIPFIVMIANTLLSSLLYIMIGGDTATYGLAVIIGISVLCSSMMPRKQAVWGILFSFITGSFLSASTYIFHPGIVNISLSSLDFYVRIAATLSFSIILVTQYKKFAINVKIMLAISMLVLISSIAVYIGIVSAAGPKLADDNKLAASLEGATIIGMAVVVSISALISLFISKIFTNQLEKLSAVAQKTVLEGDIQQEISVDTRDEIGEVAESFRAMQTYFKEMAETAARISQYDLTQQSTPRSSKDLFGIAFSGTIKSLNEIIENIQNSIEQMNSGAVQVSSASQSLSQGASEQAGALEEIASSITEISGKSRNNS